MHIHLKNIRLFEETATHKLYQCQSAHQSLPGQSLLLAEQTLEILRCRQLENTYEWVIQVPCKSHLTTEADVELIGTGTTFTPAEPVYVFAEGAGVSMALHWLDNLRQSVGNKQCRKLIRTVILAQSEGFNFAPTPSTFILPDLPSNMIAAVPLLEDLSIASRLCCDEFQPGCFEGSLADLMLAKDNVVTDATWLGFMSKQTAQAINDKFGEAAMLSIVRD